MSHECCLADSSAAQLRSSKHRPSATESREDGAEEGAITESCIIGPRGADTATFGRDKTSVACLPT
eukprot:scaffold69453_cov49-Phaeocystis_antarctica.AAC.1